jgi:hypothetical protein
MVTSFTKFICRQGTDVAIIGCEVGRTGIVGIWVAEGNWVAVGKELVGNGFAVGLLTLAASV